jgi:phosphoserine phosphatase
LSTPGPVGSARFASVVLDVDSTLSRIEGIDWLAALRGDALLREIAAMTERATRGEIALQDVYAARLAMIRPTRAEIAQLGCEYVRTVADGAHACVEALRTAGVHVVIVSGGLRDAILPLARSLGVPDTDLHAVGLSFADSGEYAGFDTTSPLACTGGKPVLVRELGLRTAVLAVGDGITDAELRTAVSPAVDAFAAFTGVARRDAVQRAADYSIERFSQLLPIVLP